MIQENKKPNNPPAFPLYSELEEKNYMGQNIVTREINNGMTLRDYFATKAMQGICVNAGRNAFTFSALDEIAASAYNIADAMLKQREL
jgi:hypothetical protein